KHWRQKLQLAHTWTNARGSSDSAEVNLVELTDTDGVRGLGESSAIARYQESADTVAAFFARVDAARLSFSDVPGSLKYLDSVAPGNHAAKCALDLALVDGAAKRARQAVYDYFSLGFRENHHVTSFSIGIDAPEAIRQKVLAAVQFPVLKLKL